MIPGEASGRIAALDLGEVYCGVAISDPGGSLARPLEVVPPGELAEYLRPLLAEGGVVEVLVGVPKTLGGEVGFQAEKALATIGILRETFPGTRFVEWDERLTTRLVQSSQPVASRKKGRGKKGKKERVDHLAAAAMLQEYLDRRAV